jgi:DNA polymerase family A/3'-5' exonuclease
LTCSQDIKERNRIIELAFADEDPNSRRFKNPLLHQSALENRSLILSSIKAIFRNWQDKGFALGTTPFTSYPQWANTIGGVMLAAGLGDPCLPFEGDYHVGADPAAAAMTEVCGVCHEAFGNDWASKRNIFERVHDAAYGAPKRVFCTMTASRLLEHRRTIGHDLGAALDRHRGIKIPKELGRSDWSTESLSREQLEYSANDVRHLHALRDTLSRRHEEARTTKILALEMELIPIVNAMHDYGFPIDAEKMRAIGGDARVKRGAFAAEICNDFGEPELNPNSPSQLLRAFRTAGIDLESTGEEILAQLDDPRAKKILDFRAEKKLAENVESLLKHEHAGRIHTSFNPTGAVMGRFTSKNPNLQNVPREPLFRSCFVPTGPDRKLVVADYSQIELRVAALIAKEAVMIDAFKRGDDLHALAAARNLGKKPKDLTKEEACKGRCAGGRSPERKISTEVPPPDEGRRIFCAFDA